MSDHSEMPNSFNNVRSPTINGGVPNQNAQLEELFSRPMNNEMLNMMMGYLRKNGLSGTEEALSREAMVFTKSESINGMTAEEALSVEFDTFVQHANSCTDVVQAEFSQLLFPVFAHCYIVLVEMRSNTVSARAFFNKFKIYIPECYAEYVYKLSLVVDKFTLQSSPHVQTLRDNKFLARLSKPAQKHLDTIMGRLIAIKNMILKHVTIDLVEEISKNRSTIESQMGGILGAVGRNDRRHKMFFSVVKDELMNSIDRKKVKGKDNKDSGKKLQTYAPSADRIPLPPQSEHLREEKKNWMREVPKMAIITAETPVSICMYTTLNAPIGVSACDISDDSNLIAMGMADSAIVVNAIDPANKMKKLREMEFLDKIDIETCDNIAEQMYDTQASSSSIRFSGHGGPVFSVNFSPDKRLLISSAGDKTVRLWSMDTQRNVVIFRTPSVVWDVQFSNRGYYFATGSFDNTAALWCTDRMHPVRIFADSFGGVGCVDFHPNCNYVVGGSEDRYVRVWDVLTGTRVRVFSGHKANVIAVKTSPDGRYVVSLDIDGNLMVWDLAYQKLVAAELTEQVGTKGSITFSRDGGVFAISHGNSNISVYSLDNLLSQMATSSQVDPALVEPKINMEGFNIGTYPTKKTDVIGLHFTRRNLLMGFGSYRP